jgi:hypothetical protein
VSRLWPAPSCHPAQPGWRSVPPRLRAPRRECVRIESVPLKVVTGAAEKYQVQPGGARSGVPGQMHERERVDTGAVEPVSCRPNPGSREAATVTATKTAKGEAIVKLLEDSPDARPILVSQSRGHVQETIVPGRDAHLRGGR